MPFMIFDQAKNSVQFIGNSQYNVARITVDVSPDFDPDALRGATTAVATAALTAANSFRAHNFASVGNGLPDSSGPWAFGSYAMTLRQLKAFTDKSPLNTMQVEGFYDKNKNGRYDATEPFIDANRNGRYDAGGETNPLTTSYSGRGFYRAASTSPDDQVPYHAVFSGVARTYNWSLDPSATGHRTLMDIHAGKYNPAQTFLGYAENATLGCIRVSDESLARLDQLHGFNPTLLGATVQTGLLVVRNVKFVGVDRSIVLADNVALVDSRDFATASNTASRALTAGAGADFLFGSKYVNVLTGAGGNDFIDGKGGKDTLYGNSGGDKLYGGTGDDTIFSGSSASDAGDTTVVAMRLDQQIFGVALSIHNFADGEAGNDKVYGAGGTDYLVGGAGSDYVYGNNGNDYIVGDLSLSAHAPAPAKVFDFDFLNAVVRAGFRGDGAYATIERSDQGYVRASEAGSTTWNDQLFGQGGNDVIYGGPGNDVIDGGDGNDQLFGGIGNDSIEGGGGNDQLFGGPGNDVLDGENGSDFYFLVQASGVYTGGDLIVDTGTGISDFDIVYFENGARPWLSTGIEMYEYGGRTRLTATAPGDAVLNVSSAGSDLTLVNNAFVQLDSGLDRCTISQSCRSAIIDQFGDNDVIDIRAFGAAYVAVLPSRAGTFAQITNGELTVTRIDQYGSENQLLSLSVFTTGSALTVADLVL